MEIIHRQTKYMYIFVCFMRNFMSFQERLDHVYQWGRRGDYQNTSCERCAQYARLVKTHNIRAKLKKDRVSKSSWPRFTEKTLPSNPNCYKCQWRQMKSRNHSKQFKDRQKEKKLNPK